MSDRQIAKQRFHKGLTAYLRRYLKRFGVSLDEEAAQFALGGYSIFDVGVPGEAIAEAINLAMANRPNLMRQWEGEHPGKNPYPPSFPERVLRLIRQALQECYDDDRSPAGTLLLMQMMCENELDTDPVSMTGADEEEL